MIMYLVIEGEGKGKMNFEYRAAIPDQCLAFIGIVTMIIVIIIMMIIMYQCYHYHECAMNNECLVISHCIYNFSKHF